MLFMRENGKTTRPTAKGPYTMQMGISMTVSGWMTRHMVKVYTHGRMERFTTENGIKESNRDMVSGKELKTTHILESGPPQKHMVMVFITGLMEIDTKDSGTCV